VSPAIVISRCLDSPAGLFSNTAAGGTGGTWHTARGIDIFSDSSIEEVVQEVRGGDAFSDSPVEGNMIAVGGTEVFLDSSEEGSPAGGAREVLADSSIQMVPATSSDIGGRNVFSDSEEEGRSNMVAGGDVYSDFSDEDDSGQKVGVGGHGAFSESEDEIEVEVKPAGTGDINSGLAAADLFSDSDSVVPPRFTAASFQMPIPESWLSASDTE
jgi:hypothetical protein